jgi:predicted ATP-grasp superfamily ATP-dependent carboligase
MTKPLNARVIVTHGRSLIALRIAHSLGRKGAEIIGCDDVKMTVLSFSKHVSEYALYAKPSKNPEKFIKDLIDIVKRFKPEDDRPYVLMPSFYEARLIAEHADQFPEYITITVPSFEAINAVDPKDHLAKTLRDYEIESPQIWLPQSEDEVRDIAGETDYPVFIKPPDEVGGRGIEKVSSAETLIEAYQKLTQHYPDKQIVIQEAVTGDDYCFCGLFDQGKLVSSMVYYNNQKFPVETGAGSVRETVDNSLFDPIAESLMQQVGWHGVCEIDFMWNGDENETPMMIEVNPRFWSGLDHSVMSGLDFPWQLYQLFVNGEVTDKSEAEIGHKTQLSGVSLLGALDAFRDEAINFDALEQEWPKIKDTLMKGEFMQAYRSLNKALDGSLSIAQAFDTLKIMRREIASAQSAAPEDDPFVGLGVLFVLSHLMKHGQLPPELSH